MLGDALDCRGVFVGILGIQFKNAKFDSQIISCFIICAKTFHSKFRLHVNRTRVN
jgi:hypothetical protein